VMSGECVCNVYSVTFASHAEHGLENSVEIVTYHVRAIH
jgi:hypothetical protein